MKTDHVLLALFVVSLIATGLLAEEPSRMPQDIQDIIEPLAGEWVWDEGKASWKWAPGKHCLIGEFSLADGTPSGVSVIGWDAKKKHIVDTGFHQGGMHTIHYSSYSQTKWSGSSEGVTADGETTTAQVSLERGNNMFKVAFTERTTGGDPEDDLKATVRLIKIHSDAAGKNTALSREAFEEFCRLNQGAWKGTVPLRQDVPGVGKKGDKVTAHYDYTIVEDGNALIGKSYWPKGTNTWFIAYDEINQRMKSMMASPVFGIGHPAVHFSDKTWVSRGTDTMEDGTKSTFLVTGTFSEDGKILRVTESITKDGETAEYHDVWHRMNK